MDQIPLPKVNTQVVIKSVLLFGVFALSMLMVGSTSTQELILLSLVISFFFLDYFRFLYANKDELYVSNPLFSFFDNRFRKKINVHDIKRIYFKYSRNRYGSGNFVMVETSYQVLPLSFTYYTPESLQKWLWEMTERFPGINLDENFTALKESTTEFEVKRKEIAANSDQKDGIFLLIVVGIFILYLVIKKLF